MTPEGRQDLARELEARIYVAEHIFDRSGGQRVRVHVPLELAKSLLALLLAEAPLETGQPNPFLMGQEHMPDCPATTPPFTGSCTCPKVEAAALPETSAIPQHQEKENDDDQARGRTPA